MDPQASSSAFNTPETAKQERVLSQPADYTQAGNHNLTNNKRNFLKWLIFLPIGLVLLGLLCLDIYLRLNGRGISLFNSNQNTQDQNLPASGENARIVQDKDKVMLTLPFNTQNPAVTGVVLVYRFHTTVREIRNHPRGLEIIPEDPDIPELVLRPYTQVFFFDAENPPYASVEDIKPGVEVDLNVNYSQVNQWKGYLQQVYVYRSASNSATPQ